MKRAALLLIICVFATSAVAQEDADKDKDPNRERLGLRAGYAATPSDLDDAFGGGLDLSLHWIQRIKYPFGFNVTLGAFYLGSTARDDITLSTFNRLFDKVSMRILRFTVSPMIEFNVSERTGLYASAGVGMYAVSLLVDEVFAEADLTNNHVGVNLGAGAIQQLSENWFVELDVQLHKFWTSSDIDDMFFRYSSGDGDPLFYQASVGVMIRLF